MSKLFSTFVFILSFNCLNGAIYADVKINEFLADNVSTNPDMYDYDDFSDWIELYNDGSAAVDLSGYSLTGKLSNPKKSVIPSGVSIPSKGFLLFWADGHNAKPGTSAKRPDDVGNTYTTKYYHCAFKLDKDGEQVGLFDAAGKVVDSVTFGPQLADVSMGRTADGTWAYFDQPTPSAENSTVAKQVTQRSGTVAFSAEAGFSAAARSVTLTSSDNGPIYYTTDCSTPNAGSTKYSTAITVNANTIIRARTITADKIAGLVATNTYFKESPRKLMVVNITTDQKFLDDATIGIFKNYYKFRKVPAVLEFFGTDGKPAVRFNAGIQVGTLNAHTCPQKPLQVALTARYGNEFVDYKFFNKPYTKFNRFRLRQGSDAWGSTFINDDLLDPISTGQMEYGIQAYKPVVAYINGKYDGIRDLREQFKAQYLKSNYNVDTAGIMEIRRFLQGTTQGWQVVHGSWSDYGTMMSLVKSATIDYKKVESQIDINHMIDFVVIETFVLNTSWGHNEDFWRVPTTKWRWLTTDIDRSFEYKGQFSSVSSDILHSDGGSIGSMSGTFMTKDTLFAKLMGVTDFKNHFLQRYAAHLNSTLKADRLNRIIDSIVGLLIPEIPDHAAKWGSQQGIKNVSVWKTDIGKMKDFCSERAPYVWTSLDKDITTGHANLTVTVTNAPAGDIYIEGVRMSEGLSGMQFFKSIPLALKAVPKKGCTFKSWGGGATGAGDSTNITLTADKTITATFEGTPPAQAISPNAPAVSGLSCSDRVSLANGRMTLSFTVSTPTSDHIRISLFNVSGQKIGAMDSEIGPGMHPVTMTSSALAPGVYFYRVQTKTFDRLKKIRIR